MSPKACFGKFLQVPAQSDDGFVARPSDWSEPKFDPNTLWRIPPDINVVPLPPPSRNIRPQDLCVLNKRRAGNRGRVNRCKTTPVSF